MPRETGTDELVFEILYSTMPVKLLALKSGILGFGCGNGDNGDGSESEAWLIYHQAI